MMSINPDYIVSKEILKQEKEFSIRNIFDNVKNKLNTPLSPDGVKDSVK